MCDTIARSRRATRTRAGRDPVVGETPKLFHQPIIQFRLPLMLEECLDRLPALEEFCPASPVRIFRISLGDNLRIAAVPSVLRDLHLGQSAIAGERGTNSEDVYRSVV